MAEAAGRSAEPAARAAGPVARVLRVPLLPYLVAVPVIALTVINHWSLAFEEALAVGGRWIGIIAVLHLASGMALRSARRGAILITPAVIAWCYFATLFGTPSALKAALVLPAALIIGYACLRWSDDLLPIGNFVATALLVQPLLLIYDFAAPLRPQPRTDATHASVPHIPGTARLPHIVHIMLDGYPRSDVLSDLHGIDNSGFERELEKIGFRVFRGARSNYGQTLLSMSAVFEMNDVDGAIGELSRSLGLEPGRLPAKSVRTGLSWRFASSRSLTALRRAGYRIVTAESSYPRAVPTGADEVVGPRHHPCEFDFFEYALYRKTPWTSLCEAAAGRSLIYSRHYAYLRFLSESPPVEDWDRPTYYYHHVLSPHAPFIIDGEGRYVPGDPRFEIFDATALGKWREGLYARGLPRSIAWLNRAVLANVRGIVSRSRRPVVIVIHGDHGTALRSQPNDAATTCVRERFSPFVAVYSTSGRLAASLPDDLDLQMIFRGLLGAELGAPDVPIEARSSYFAPWTAPGRREPLSRERLALPCEPPASIAMEVDDE